MPNSAAAAAAGATVAEASGFDSLHFLFRRKKLEKKNPSLICFGFLGKLRIAYSSVQIKTRI